MKKTSNVDIGKAVVQNRPRDSKTDNYHTVREGTERKRNKETEGQCEGKTNKKKMVSNRPITN